MGRMFYYHFTEVEYSRIHVLADLGQVHGEDASLKLIQISFTEREEYWAEGRIAIMMEVNLIYTGTFECMPCNCPKG